MTTIYLLRHVKYSNPEDLCAGRLPFELSEEGMADALKLQKYFEDKDITKIYSSQVMRCKQTAETVSNGEISIEFDQRLLETLTVRQGVPHGNNTENYYGYVHILGGETQQDVFDRVSDFWDSMKWEDNKNYIVCSHGDPLHFLYLHLYHKDLGMELEEGVEISNLPGYPGKGSVRQVRLENGELEIGEIIGIEDLD